MSVITTQPTLKLREELIKNKQRYGLKGKQILESETVEDVRSLIGAGRKNLIINGGFDIWQRGANFTLATSLKVADKWNISSNATGSITRESFVNGQSEVPDSPQYFCRIEKTNTADYVDFRTHIEGNLSSKTVTVSGYVKVSNTVNTNQFRIRFLQQFDNGNTDSSQDYRFDIRENTWTKFEWTVKLVDWIGGPSNGNEFVKLILYPQLSDVNWVGTFDIANVQLEFSDQATEFEQRTVAEELKLCQRYFQKSYEMDTAPGTITKSGIVYEHGVRNNSSNTIGAEFSTRMRTSPVITLYSNTTGTVGTVNNGPSIPGTAAQIGETGWGKTNVTGGTTGGLAFHYTADAEL